MSLPGLPAPGLSALEAMTASMSDNAYASDCYEDMQRAAWTISAYENVTHILLMASTHLLLTCSGAILSGIVGKVAELDHDCKDIPESILRVIYKTCYAPRETFNDTMSFLGQCVLSASKSLHNITSACSNSPLVETSLGNCESLEPFSDVCRLGVWQEYARMSSSSDAESLMASCDSYDDEDASTCRFMLAGKMTDNMTKATCESACDSEQCLEDCTEGVSKYVSEHNINNQNKIEIACTSASDILDVACVSNAEEMAQAHLSHLRVNHTKE